MSKDDLTPGDLALINDEVERYQKCWRRIHEEFKNKTVELDHDEKLARALTAEIVATRRDEEKQFLLSDESVAHGLAHLRFKQANALSDLTRQPYFARVIYREKGRDVEFKLGVASFPEERIIDWRKAPISKLYYDYEEGEQYEDEIAGVERSGEIKLKRAYRGNHDELGNVELRDVSYFKNRGEWRRFNKHKRTVFSVNDKEKVRELIKTHAPLSAEQLAGGDGYLAQILALLSPEQFRLISSDMNRPVIIQGSAGTGKTTVAMHRLAWLLFEGNSPAREESCLVIVPNPTLAAYVKNVLPALGVHGVKIATYEDWKKDIVASKRKYPVSFDHLVIDEAQDFTITELKTLLNALRDENQLTIAGDLGQRISGNSDFSSWPELLGKLGLSGVDVLNLNVAYRSTYQIYEIAAAIRDPNVCDDELKMTARFGPDPLNTICHNFNEAIEVTRAWIEDVININQKATGAVVCRTQQEARLVFAALMKQGVHGIRFGDVQHFEFTPGITVTDVAPVKGLEFQFELLFYPSEKNYPAANAQERNLLYVAVTRAIYRLDMVCFETPTAILPEFINTRDLTAIEAVNAEAAERRLFDGIEMREEETESKEAPEENGDDEMDEETRDFLKDFDE